MYEDIKRLYETGKLTAIGLSNAVNKGWITKDEKKIIMSETISIKDSKIIN